MSDAKKPSLAAAIFKVGEARGQARISGAQIRKDFDKGWLSDFDLDRRCEAILDRLKVISQGTTT